MKKLIKGATLAILVITSFGATRQAFAAVGEQGVDWSHYNGYQGNFGYASDQFSISQIGGTYGGYYVDQLTYNSQVQNTLEQGKRAHSYIYYEVGNSIPIAKGALDRYLPKIATPKGSIVALDYESGASGSKQANTDAILYGMRRVKEAGYTPMYYSYKPYTIANVDYKRIIKEFPGSLWIAEYPNYEVTPTPNWNFFPSMDDIGIFQFTSTYVAGGLDGNIDLTGITDKGYDGKVPDPAPTPNPTPTPSPSKKTHIVQYGDTLSSIAYNWGTSWQELARQNALSNPNLIYAGQAISYSGGSNAAAGGVYTVQYGDNLSVIAQRLGTTVQHLVSSNGIQNPNLIYAGQTLNY
ncbi:LysM peptidoglycan-binding domain-containing protein [Lactococcus garvieae subsp. garvieae]|uniref:LysM peptidoglycan-binding domain-containing protein n=1 Tax=Lactococcus garvieae TaxID=1363 RepID=UPI0005A9675D|nr:LysM peptidoglycan-binding domain-containing protein [Lactococcus garvieae]KAA8718830.1 LysM peptidoglycan-binding domain-containing protein [Lactococcus garvieae subsp. garvieae]MDG6191129.1 LysM peptidoglycan-binding domain-containing protein [Lactococcus garvieae]PCS00281.1 1,4-beta-N-acetylmuramidase [Lactococcus garvieae]QPR48967.1 LysM peptidoglycan-binding domain-containing protein [Lactococcus garvieae]